MLKRKQITVYYDGSIDDAHQAIKNALEDAGDNARNVYVIAKPLPDDELNHANN